MQDKQPVRFSGRAVLFFLILLCGLSYPTVSLAAKGLLDNETISLSELRKKIRENPGTLLILDARSPESFEKNHIVGAQRPFTETYYSERELYRRGLLRNHPDQEKSLAIRMKEFDPSRTSIVTYCSDHCQASAVLLTQIKRLGFSQVWALEPGFDSWVKAGHPVTRVVTNVTDPSPNS